MKLYQMVSAADGVRSPVLTSQGFPAIAAALAPQVLKRPELADDYVLILVEDADGAAYPSRAPMMRVSTVIETFLPKEATPLDTMTNVE